MNCEENYFSRDEYRHNRWLLQDSTTDLQVAKIFAKERFTSQFLLDAYEAHLIKKRADGIGAKSLGSISPENHMESKGLDDMMAEEKAATIYTLKDLGYITIDGDWRCRLTDSGVEFMQEHWTSFKGYATPGHEHYQPSLPFR